MELELTTLLQEVYNRDGSDLHLVAGQPPVFRIDGVLTPREDGPILDNDTLTRLILPHLSEQFRMQLEAGQDVLVTLRHGNGVFRMNVFHEQSRLGAAVRVMPTKVPTLDDLGLNVKTLPTYDNQSVLHVLTKSLVGLILVVGGTGSGKSTLAAAMIEEINRTRSERILTIEHPVEYVFQSKQSIITQRTVGEDVSDFPTALRSALRSDADVVFVGQSVDLETLALSLGTANTGHLVFSVLNVDSATEAIQRILEVFPPGAQRESTRRLLARNLLAIIAQKLLPPERNGRVPVHEILIATPRIKQMILDGATDFTVGIEAGRDVGMQTMDDAITASYKRGDISYKTALFNLTDRDRITAPVN